MGCFIIAYYTHHWARSDQYHHPQTHPPPPTTHTHTHTKKKKNNASYSNQKELIWAQVAFSNPLPRLETGILCVCLPQLKASDREAQTAVALIKFVSFFLCNFLFIICEVPVKEAQMWHVSCKTISRLCKNCALTFQSFD